MKKSLDQTNRATGRETIAGIRSIFRNLIEEFKELEKLRTSVCLFFELYSDDGEDFSRKVAFELQFLSIAVLQSEFVSNHVFVVKELNRIQETVLRRDLSPPVLELLFCKLPRLHNTYLEYQTRFRQEKTRLQEMGWYFTWPDSRSTEN